MKKMLLLADSLAYLKSNCYQSQLLATLKESYKIRLVSHKQILNYQIPVLENFDVILSVLRLRTLLNIVIELKDQLYLKV